MGEEVENATHGNVSRHCSLSNSQAVVTGCQARGKRGGDWSGVAGSQDSVAENRSRTPEARSPCTAQGTELLHCLCLQAPSHRLGKDMDFVLEDRLNNEFQFTNLAFRGTISA